MPIRLPTVDDTLALAMQGYGWMPNRRRRAGTQVVHARLLGRRAVGLCGPEAARFFYDERHVRRGTALPEPVLSTLFGHGAVHTLDGDRHRHRKSMFMSLMAPPSVAALAGHTTAAWDQAVASWPGRPPVVLFDEASRSITQAVCGWAGVPLAEAEVDAMAADLVAMVDGFATLGPRHWRARLARRRREAQLAGLIERIRRAEVAVPEGSAAQVIADHRELDGRPLPARVAAVELINVVRPTVAVSWLVALAGHALHRWPAYRAPLRTGDPAVTEAFAQEVRRFYPFVPFVGGRAAADLSWHGEPIPAGTLVLLDLYGHNHDPRLWPRPYDFRPERFACRQVDPFELVPQGAGDPYAGHRCPGEAITLALLAALAARLALLDLTMPEQDLTIPLRRVPTRPRSGVVVTPTLVPT